MEFVSEFSKWLDTAMYEAKGRKYKQVHLANDLEVSPSAVSNWFTLDQVPRDDLTILKIAALFGKTPEFVYEKVGKKPPKEINRKTYYLLFNYYRLSNAGREKLSVESERLYEAESQKEGGE